MTVHPAVLDGQTLPRSRDVNDAIIPLGVSDRIALVEELPA